MEETVVLTPKIEDTVVVKLVDSDLIAITFMKALYDDAENTQQAQAAIKKANDLVKDHNLTAVKIRVNLQPMKDKAYLSGEAKGLYKDFVLSDTFIKVAVVGSTDSQTSIANFILTFFDRKMHKKLSWFSTTEEADVWLNS